MSTADPSDPTPFVRARGSATRWVPADYADVSFSVSGRGETTAEAIAHATAAYAALDALLTGQAVVQRRTTVALEVRPAFRWDRTTGEQVAEGFAAERTESVRLAPPRDANQLLQQVTTEVAGLSMQGPRFGVEPDHAVHDEVRAAAAVDARRSATAYAAGLGHVLGAVISVTEPSMSELAARTDIALMSDAAFKVRGGAEGEGAQVVDLVDQDVDVHATVEVQIALR